MTATEAALEHGTKFSRPHPFTMVTENKHDPEREYERWRPGAWELVMHGTSSIAACHEMGTVTFTVVSTHKPPGYPERVFFTRQFFLPDGEKYAPARLMNCVKRKFLRDVANYPVPFVVENFV